MKKIVTITALCCLPLGAVLAEDAEMQSRIDSSKAAIAEFSSNLKGQLEAAMKEGGPVNAIKVCHSAAPSLSRSASGKYKMNVARTSFKTRNPANTPDAWETKVLKSFEERKAKGEPLDNMTYSEVVVTNGRKEFRFMKAIPVGEVCLKCHGETIEPAVKAKLIELYPGDKATGYKLGDLRGAFTVRQSM